MRLKLDENLSRHLKPALVELGHDVDTVAEERLLSRPDGDIAAAAKSAGRMLFTLDLDFSDIRAYPPGGHPGIILFRPTTLGPLHVNRFVVDFVIHQDLNMLVGCVAVAEPGRLRVRRP